MTEPKKTKTAELLTQIEKLLKDPDCVVRVQREMIHDGISVDGVAAFVPGKRVTIIIVGTPKS